MDPAPVDHGPDEVPPDHGQQQPLVPAGAEGQRRGPPSQPTEEAVAQLDLLVEAAVLFGARDRGRATHAESSGLNFVIEQLVLPSLDRTQNSGQRTDEMQLQFGMMTL